MQQTDLAAPLGARGTTRPGNTFRLLPALEKAPRVVRFAQTKVGRATLILVFGAIASLLSKPAAAVGVALVLLFPQRRRLMVALASLGMVIVTHRLDELLRGLGKQEGLSGLAHHVAFKPAMLLLSLVLTVGYIQLAKTWLSGQAIAPTPLDRVRAQRRLARPAFTAPAAGRLAPDGLGGRGRRRRLLLVRRLQPQRSRRPARSPLLKDASAWRPFWGRHHGAVPQVPVLSLEKLEVRTQERLRSGSSRR